jgi:hypothetical protein
MISKASFSHQRCGFEFGAINGIGSGESGVDQLSRRRERKGGRGVLLIGYLTLPFAAGTTIGANEIKERGDAEQRGAGADPPDDQVPDRGRGLGNDHRRPTS